MTDTQHKAFPAEVKAIDDATGQVEALVAVFGNVDHGGDRIVKGAFQRSIKEWQDRGDPIPVVFSHAWGDLWSHIGVVDDIEETDKGLLARYTLDVHDNPAAAQVYKLMKRRSLKEHSFAYGIKDAKVTKDGVNELRDLDIFEVGPTLKGMNPDTELLSVKSALEQADRLHDAEKATAFTTDTSEDTTEDTGTKAGRSLSKANEKRLRTAMESIATVLSSLGTPEDDEENPEKSSVHEDETNTKDVQEDADGGGKSSGLDVELLSYLARIDQLKEK